MPIKVLFVGLGSIGTRHLKNLVLLAGQRGLPLEIEALRSGAKAGELPAGTGALLARQITAPAELAAHYDLAFITNPTSLHAGVLALLKGRVGCYFIEKPIFETAAGLTLPEGMGAGGSGVLPGAPGADAGKEPLSGTSAEQTSGANGKTLSGTALLAALGLDAASGQKAYVAAPMRWCGVMQALQKRLPGLAPYSARAICSSYLPGWRPNVDYRTVYSAHRVLGGGVGIDLIHEWDYLVDLFGMPQQVFQFAGKYSHLEIDSDDLAVYIARYPSLLAELHLDYFGRSYRRTLELFCKEGTLTADFGEGTLTLENGSKEKYEEPLNVRYLRELDYFLDYALEGEGTSVNSPETALQVLALTLGQTLPQA